MLYRRNEKGRYEAVTDKGEIISFDDASEMIAFVEMRKSLNNLLGKEEKAEFLVMQNSGCMVQNETEHKKVVKVRINKGTYEYDGTGLKRKPSRSVAG